eukprot:1161556-Pelagomonas_calceolata.AAC.2
MLYGLHQAALRKQGTMHRLVKEHRHTRAGAQSKGSSKGMIVAPSPQLSGSIMSRVAIPWWPNTGCVMSKVAIQQWPNTGTHPPPSCTRHAPPRTACCVMSRVAIHRGSKRRRRRSSTIAGRGLGVSREAWAAGSMCLRAGGGCAGSPWASPPGRLGQQRTAVSAGGELEAQSAIAIVPRYECSTCDKSNPNLEDKKRNAH